MSFKPYDPAQRVDIHRRRLPHWAQPGVTYFVTFRLMDSLPAIRLRELDEERLSWLLARGMATADDLASQPETIRREYARKFNARWHELLDAGYGECLLRTPAHAEIVASALRHFHGDRLELDLAVVMPNHVHLLLAVASEWGLSDVLHSIKRFSAREINAGLSRKGALWLDENFDHIVRSEAQLEHYRRYIRENPVKAGLRAGEYWLGGGGDRVSLQAG